MKKKTTKDIRDIFVTFGVILFVRFILCYFNKTEMFTTYFLLFIVVFILSSIIYKFILKGDK